MFDTCSPTKQCRISGSFNVRYWNREKPSSRVALARDALLSPSPKQAQTCVRINPHQKQQAYKSASETSSCRRAALSQGAQDYCSCSGSLRAEAAARVCCAVPLCNTPQLGFGYLLKKTFLWLLWLWRKAAQRMDALSMQQYHRLLLTNKNKKCTSSMVHVATLATPLVTRLIMGARRRPEVIPAW